MCNSNLFLIFLQEILVHFYCFYSTKLTDNNKSRRPCCYAALTLLTSIVIHTERRNTKREEREIAIMAVIADEEGVRVGRVVSFRFFFRNQVQMTLD
jgi:hypothetical protein